MSGDSSFDATRDDIEHIVTTCICDFFFVEARDVDRRVRFEEDLSADRVTLHDCLDMIEQECIERSWGITIDARDRKEIETVGDVIDTISTELGIAGES